MRDRAAATTLRNAAIYALAALFLLAAGAHFVFVDTFASIVPGPLPFAREIVMLTGLVEGLLAVGLLIPSLRRLAGTGLAIYCVVVWPANVQMALDGTAFAGVTLPAWVLWARVAMQVPLIALIVWAAALVPAQRAGR
ncbi:MAG: hypothetical protein AAF580_14970 [Pseudomonadota bacterium]